MHKDDPRCCARKYFLAVDHVPVVKYPDVAMSAIMSIDMMGYLNNRLCETVQSRLYSAACKGGIVFW